VTTEPYAAPVEPRRAYTRPRLVVYGRLEELTLTEVQQNPMNDMFDNFKTA
jgi:hypothetical protein